MKFVDSKVMYVSRAHRLQLNRRNDRVETVREERKSRDQQGFGFSMDAAWPKAQ